MSKEKVFYQNYENLENDLLEMTNYIHFSDENLQTYSLKLSSFILSCSVEIESLFKEIGGEYCKSEIASAKQIEKQRKDEEKENGKKYTKKSEMSILFEAATGKYSLKKKGVHIKSNRFYFQRKYGSYFCPLEFKKSLINKKGKKEEKNLSDIYNAIKHDRSYNLSLSTIEVAINKLALLYLLNIYYGYPRNQSLYIGEHKKGEKLHFNSKVFEVKIAEVGPLLYAATDKGHCMKKIEEYLKTCSFIQWYDFDESHEDYILLLSDERESFEHFINNHRQASTEEKVLKNKSNPVNVFGMDGCYKSSSIFEQAWSYYLNDGYSISILKSELSKFMGGETDTI